MKNRLPKKKTTDAYEHHSNLALFTTVIALISFVVLMLVYIGDHTPQRIDVAIGASKVCAAIYWICAAALAVNAVRKSKKYLAEYIVYMIILGFGLFFMYNMPMFVYSIIKDTVLATNWARAIFRILAAGSVAYSAVSIIWHVVLATPRRNK